MSGAEQVSSSTTTRTHRRALQALKGHANPVTSVAFSTDGTRLASASEDKTVQLWDATTGEWLQTLEGHRDRVTSVAFSTDGTRLASASWDGTVRLWDATTGEWLQTLEGHRDQVTSVAFSTDGTRLASASEDKTVRLWDATTGEWLQTLEGHAGPVISVAFSTNGTQLASGSRDMTVRLWDATTGEWLQTLEGHVNPVPSVAFSTDGAQLASASWDGTVRLWDATTGELLQTLKGHINPVTSVAFSTDGTRLASASWDRTVRLWDATTGELLQRLTGHINPVTSVAFSTDGAQLASASEDKTVRLWDATTGEWLQTLEGQARQLIRTVVDSLDLFLLDSDVITITCHARWEVLACCRAEVDDLHNIAQTVTFTGNSRHAQAASCAEYLRQTWPKTGDAMMRAFRQAVTERICDVEFSQKHRLKLQLEPAIDKLEQPESASVEITGSRSNIVETLEQLAWLAATFRKPQGGGMTSSYANLTPATKLRMLTKTPALLELALLSQRAVPFKAGTPGSCWIPLLDESILACGFPIAPRGEGWGLEVPVPLMMYLAGVHYPIEYDGKGIVFRSHIRPDPGDFSMLVPTKKLGKAVQWHFVETKTDQGHPDDGQHSKFINDMVNSNSWYQTKDLDVLTNSRAFLGCWPYAKVLIGTGEFHSQTILDSDLPTAGLELHISTAGNVNIGVNISAGIATILRVGMTFGIAFGYEVRRAQQIAIDPELVGRPLVFRNASQQPLLLYDSGAQTAWLVSELSVALDMAHHFLASLNLAPSIKSKLRYAKATADGGAAALDALNACCNVILWEDETRKIRFHHVVNIILSIFGGRKPATQLPRLSSFNVTKALESPRGWEYEQLRILDPGVHRQKKANGDHKTDRSWWRITKNPTVLVLFGRGFGQVIQPNLVLSPDCPTWRAVPDGRGLLMASMPCLQKLSKDNQYTLLKHSELRWHQDEESTLFRPCQPGRACVRIQELRKLGLLENANRIKAPANDLLMPLGAVVFGKFPKNEQHQPCPGPPIVDHAGTEAWKLVLLALALVVGMLAVALMRT